MTAGVTARDVPVAGGGTLRAYDAGGGDAMALVWHHGSPQTGAPLEPLRECAARRDIRLVTYARPSYGGSTARPGRDVASAAADVAAVADAFGIERFATMGASGGGPHALACAALLGDRVTAVVALASIAPYARDGDWFAGMQAPGALGTALDGREARARFAQTDDFDPDSFTAADWDALRGRWGPLGSDAQAAEAAGPDGLIDDDVAFVRPWRIDLGAIAAPVLLVQGGDDRVVPSGHAFRLLDEIGHAELWLRPRDGHVSVLEACALAMDWLGDPWR